MIIAQRYALKWIHPGKLKEGPALGWRNHSHLANSWLYVARHPTDRAVDACLAPLRAIKVIQAVPPNPDIVWRKLANTIEATRVRADCAAYVRRQIAASWREPGKSGIQRRSTSSGSARSKP